MGTDIGQLYKHSQSQLSTSSLNAPVISSSDPQTSSDIESTTKSVPFVTDKKNVLYSQNKIHNDASITNNDNIQSCEISRKKIIALQPFQHLIIIHNLLLPHS